MNPDRALHLSILVVFAALGTSTPGPSAEPSSEELPRAEVKEKNLQPIKHDDGLRCMVFSRDGKLLATASDDRSARVWEIATGKPVGDRLTHEAVVKGVAFSPDGTIVATASGDRTARMWDARTGKPLGKPLRHQAAVNVVAFSPNGKLLLTAGDGGSVRFWSVPSGEPAGPVCTHRGAINQLGFLPDGKTLLTSCWDRSIHKWDIDSRKELGPAISEDVGVTDFSISRDGRILLTGSRDTGCQVWEIATSRPVIESFATDFIVSDVALSPDGRTFLVAGSQQLPGGNSENAQFRETSTGRPISDPLPGQNCIAMHPAGTMVATAGDNGVVHLWEVKIRPAKPQPAKNVMIEALWQDLAGEDAATAFRAIRKLTAVPQQTVPYLKQHMKSVVRPDEKYLKKLIADLDSETFNVREKAERELGEQRGLAEPLLRIALENNPTREAQQRMRRILSAENVSEVQSEQLRSLRSLQILEEIDTAEARDVLRKFVTDRDVQLAREAAAALKRLSSAQ